MGIALRVYIKLVLVSHMLSHRQVTAAAIYIFRIGMGWESMCVHRSYSGPVEVKGQHYVSFLRNYLLCYFDTESLIGLELSK